MKMDIGVMIIRASDSLDIGMHCSKQTGWHATDDGALLALDGEVRTILDSYVGYKLNFGWNENTVDDIFNLQ